MARLLRHRQTKGAETVRLALPPPRRIPTLPPSDLPSLAQNVGSWGISGRQFRAAGLPSLAISGLSRHVPMSVSGLFWGIEIPLESG